MSTRTIQSQYVECTRCGHDEKEITYLEALGEKVRTCTRCGYSW